MARDFTTTAPPSPLPVAEASRRLAASTVTEAVAAMSPMAMDPPPVAPIAAISAPAMVMGPLACRLILPPFFDRLLASMIPSALMAPPRSWLAAAALSSTLPPLARMMPPASISEATVDACTCTPTSEVPSKLSTAASPEARATVPSRASISPSLVTLAPTSAA